ncbi:hypothetical protein OIDMADRAFT_206491 [Oidiodendron maius Zn]|uniref:NB-ARC domain-containing protein n=1 Tax=Oidiodendron maius (strain Zn) TaxID=913774 RepID=A0A0C3GYR1_OIDMZ|nr:hypothetical protein OIDMADRAFT_206491 [Oidiodendron maius Zn]
MDMNATVIGALLPGSAELKLCQETFTTQWAKRRESLTVRTFQESKAVIGIRFGGINKLIVPPDSSTLEHPNERARTIDADHINMVKFSGRYDRTYEMVKGDIEELVRRAEEMAGRAVPDPAQSAYKDYEMQQRMSRTTVDAKTVHPPFSSIPLTVLPFGRNREFVGRKSQLDRLITTLHTNKTEDCPCIALVGLGGVGKTQIALECAFRLKTISPTCSVFWVRASDQMSFDDAYRDIGQQLHILELENDKADIKRLVKRRLSQESTGMWLMIIDSADDFEMFYNSNDTNVSGILSEYLPFSTLGAILFTTRDREAATRYTSSNVIEVDEMNNTDARELLRHSLQSKQPNQDEEGVTKLLKLLVNLPLAIMQAVAYLNTRECTITEYLRIYEESSDNVIKLLSQDFNDARRYPGIKNPVATTWFISFEQILVRDPLAADYIAFISCVKEQDIPRDLLPPASEFEQKEALYTLKAFRFINEHGAELYNMHRLVHLAAQQWLKLKDKWNSWNESALEQVARVFPFPQHENRALWMLYLPHAHCLIATLNMELKRTNETNQLIADLLHKLGECSKIKGNYATAEVMYRQALQLRETVLGKEHPDTLTSMSNLAVSLHWQGKYAVAEDIHRQTLHLREAVLEKDHPDTLTSMSNLALSLHWQGKYAAADTMHRQTLELRKKVLRRDHPDTLKSMNNLALSLHWQRKYAEAEAMHRDTLEIRIKELGKDHLETITSMSNLAVSLQWQKKYVEAETMHRRILDIRERVLGKDHPQTLTSMNNLALSRSWQGKYAEAEAMHQQTLQLRETVLGKEHPDTLTSMRNLALSLRRQGKNAKAEALQLHVLERRDEVLGGATHIR